MALTVLVERVSNSLMLNGHQDNPLISVCTEPVVFNHHSSVLPQQSNLPIQTHFSAEKQCLID